jgi:hypothetical protein
MRNKWVGGGKKWAMLFESKILFSNFRELSGNKEEDESKSTVHGDEGSKL